MTLQFNRFAIVPHLCPTCKLYIWLEPYRRSYVWRLDNRGYVKENICKRCLPKYINIKGE